MAFPLPSSLSPSKVSSFKECALAFRLSNIDRVPEPPSPWATKGTLVHRALQLLFWDEDPGHRTLPAALDKLARAEAEMASDPEFTGLALSEEDAAAFHADAEALVRRYFELEDPNEVRVIGVELKLEAKLGSLTLRGIIDRLELDGDGELVVTDYKTGRSPGASFELPRMAGVHFYAFLCEQVLGRRPARIQLLHLAEPVAISLVPSEQSIRGLQNRTQAIWTAVERACQTEDFRPKVGKLCDFCAYKAYCPAFGGDLSAVPVRPEADPAPAPALVGAS
ncbi:MAG TPA: PD-(D/E)XK nuclease family protein [Acidimicrobiales bacterium]|nr:PD-(D/E)XK nuclease family protein [Acidimicrobiales bacterium]